MKVYCDASTARCWLGLVTVMSTVWTTCAGVVTSSRVASTQRTIWAAVAPKVTAGVPTKPEPRMTSVVPPSFVPTDLEMLVIAGGIEYASATFCTLRCWFGFLTMTAVFPTGRRGDSTLSCRGTRLLSVTRTLTPPIKTVAPASKWSPVSNTVSPPPTSAIAVLSTLATVPAVTETDARTGGVA
nr:hypothetical protein [Myxococcus hansupus]